MDRDRVIKALQNMNTGRCKTDAVWKTDRFIPKPNVFGFITSLTEHGGTDALVLALGADFQMRKWMIIAGKHIRSRRR